MYKSRKNFSIIYFMVRYPILNGCADVSIAASGAGSLLTYQRIEALEKRILKLEKERENGVRKKDTRDDHGQTR